MQLYDNDSDSRTCSSNINNNSNNGIIPLVLFVVLVEITFTIGIVLDKTVRPHETSFFFKLVLLLP